MDLGSSRETSLAEARVGVMSAASLASANPDGLTRLMKPVGPVAKAFGLSQAFLSLIMGPVGGGKTTECIAKCLRVGLAQKAVWDAERGCFVKRARGLVIRDTYPNLDRTVIKSWHQWFPKTMGKWSGEAPRTHAFTLNIGQPGTRGFYQLDLEMIFTAIGDNAVEDVLRGLEVTFAWPNEWDLLPKNLLEVLIGRVGRYPSAIQGGCAFPAIFGDCNAPEEDNHLVPLFGIECDRAVDSALEQALVAANDNRALIEFHRQPGGLDEGAENLHNIGWNGDETMPMDERIRRGRLYYLRQAALLPADMKRRLIDNRLGPVRHGTPVYPEFRDEYHVREFEIDPRLPVLIGADQGICPGVVMAQLDPLLDQLRIFDEMARIFENADGSIEVSQMGGRAFGREVAIRLQTAYPGLTVGFVCADPAAAQGEQAIDQRSWRQDFQRGLGVQVRKARVPGNALEPRLNAMRDRLNGQTRGHPKLLVHRRCAILRKAFNTKYAWQRVSVGGTDAGRFGSTPLKIQGYADVMNAAEYLVFEVDRGVEQAAVSSARARPQREFELETDYRMHGGRL